VHALIDVTFTGMPYAVVQRAVHFHPAVSDRIPTMLGQLEPLA